MSLTPFLRLPKRFVRSTCSRLRRRSFKSELKWDGKRTYKQTSPSSQSWSVTGSAPTSKQVLQVRAEVWREAHLQANKSFKSELKWDGKRTYKQTSPSSQSWSVTGSAPTSKQVLQVRAEVWREAHLQANKSFKSELKCDGKRTYKQTSPSSQSWSVTGSAPTSKQVLQVRAEVWREAHLQAKKSFKSELKCDGKRTYKQRSPSSQSWSVTGSAPTSKQVLQVRAEVWREAHLQANKSFKSELKCDGKRTYKQTSPSSQSWSGTGSAPTSKQVFQVRAEVWREAHLQAKQRGVAML